MYQRKTNPDMQHYVSHILFLPKGGKQNTGLRTKHQMHVALRDNDLIVSCHLMLS